MLVTHDLVGGRSLRRQAPFQPHQGRHNIRILVAQPLDELDSEGLRQRGLFVPLKDEGDWLGRMPVHAQEPVGQSICFPARCPAAHDALGRASKILHEHDPQRDRDRPQLSDRQRLDALVGAHEPAQHVGVETTVRMGNEGPRDAEHPRISDERSVGQLRQLAIVAGRQIVTDFPDLLFDNVVIVEQPLGGRRHGVPRAGRVSDGCGMLLVEPPRCPSVGLRGIGGASASR